MPLAHRLALVSGANRGIGFEIASALAREGCDLVMTARDERSLGQAARTIEKTGLLTELRAREFYEKPTAERKRKLAAAVKRHYKRLRSQQLPPKLF